MAFYAIALGVAVVVSLVSGGSLRRLGEIRLRALWALFASLAIQIGLELVSLPEARFDTLGIGLLMASYALLLAFCATNLRLRGMAIVMIGIGLNALVIGLNQGMPTKVATMIDDGVEVPVADDTVKHQAEQPDDWLGFLGDTIVLPEPFNEVISFGDLILAAGFVNVCFAATRRSRRPSAPLVADSAPVAPSATPEPEVVLDLVTYEDIDRLAPDRRGARSGSETVPRSTRTLSRVTTA